MHIAERLLDHHKICSKRLHKVLGTINIEYTTLLRNAYSLLYKKDFVNRKIFPNHEPEAMVGDLCIHCKFSTDQEFPTKQFHEFVCTITLLDTHPVFCWNWPNGNPGRIPKLQASIEPVFETWMDDVVYSQKRQRDRVKAIQEELMQVMWSPERFHIWSTFAEGFES